MRDFEVGDAVIAKYGKEAGKEKELIFKVSKVEPISLNSSWLCRKDGIRFMSQDCRLASEEDIKQHYATQNLLLMNEENELLLCIKDDAQGRKLDGAALMLMNAANDIKTMKSYSKKLSDQICRRYDSAAKAFSEQIKACATWSIEQLISMLKAGNEVHGFIKYIDDGNGDSCYTRFDCNGKDELYYGSYHGSDWTMLDPQTKALTDCSISDCPNEFGVAEEYVPLTEDECKAYDELHFAFHQ